MFWLKNILKLLFSKLVNCLPCSLIELVHIYVFENLLFFVFKQLIFFLICTRVKRDTSTSNVAY